ncbi:TipAS antibiotic-recognition domain-containing protein [Corynebacterium phoceense]|nr:TipAS antibiotic-recognition domain-containing protein [Corynebacterium phoceense]MCQ9345235.1 TipAS antibiotic-recognition domain-containing protein [Corynebacterium phoceense]
MKDTNLSVDEIATVLGDAHFAEHHEEAEDRYGGSDDWAISQKNAAQRTAGDWADLKSRTEEIEVRLAAACAAGTTPESEEARALVEEHRTLLCEHFPVSPAKHVLIARGYTADPRFKAHYDERQTGLAEWLQAAINAAAAAQGVDSDSAVWE